MPKLDEEMESSFVGKLKAFYYKLEDGYYAFLDSLHEKGVDLYKYFVEPIENHGIPSFPVAIALSLVILGGILYGAAILATPTGTVNISLSTASGAVDGIPVTLVLDGSDFATKPTLNGTASFENVPLNRRAQVRVNHPSFQPVLRDVSFAPSGTTSLEILLESKSPETRDFVVTVLDQLTGGPVRDASVSFQSLSTGLTGSATTQPDGTAVIKLDPSDSIISLSINAENFEATQRSVLVNESHLTVQLNPANSTRQTGGDQAVRGTVVVNVTDTLGNFISANVQLFANGSSDPLASDNVESGVARFENVAPVGTSVYAVVQPTSESYLSTQSTSQEIPPAEDLEFTVQVENATAANSQRVSIKVVSDTNSAIHGAKVTLFSSSTNQLITQGTSDDTGSVSFTLASTVSLENTYVAVNADNYLPNIASISSRDSTVQLTPLAAGNNVEFDAEVLDAENQPASQATIELRDGSGRLYGLSEVAGPDGKATFKGIPVDISLRLFALLDGATGQSDVFQVSFAENGQRTVSFNLERPVGTMLVTALNLIDASPVNNAFVTAFAGSVAGQAVANCTTDATGTCSLEGAWANKDLFIVTSANGFESSTSSVQFVSPGQTKHINLYILNEQFKQQTVINLVSLLDDKGNEVINFPTIEKGRIYTARFAASFANGSQTQGVFVRVGDQSTTASDPTVIKSFEFSPATLGTPLAVHSTSYLPGSDCSADLLNNDVNNQGKKWVEVHYNGVSGVVELTLQVFVKPTAVASSDKLNFHYRAFAVQNGKYSRNPYDNELMLDRRSQAKDECYADTIDKQIPLVEGSSVCNDAGTSCVSVSFNSPEQPALVGSPFIATINRPFNLNFEIRNFGPIEGSSSYARIISTSGLVKFNSYDGQGTSSLDEAHTSVRTLFAGAQDVYNGSISATGVIPADFASFKVEFGDSRGVIASNSRAFVVVQGTGALTLSQLTPTGFEVGKSKDLHLTVKTSGGQPINDATIAFEEENGSPFNGDVPAQVAGDNTPANGLDGQYVIRRIRPVSPGTFTIKVSRDRFAPVSQTLTSNVASFFEFDQPDFISLSCNATTLRVKNTLDVAVTADVFVDPSCVNVAGTGLTQVASEGGQGQQGQAGTSHYRIPDFKPGRTRLISLSPNSNQSCQLEVSATDSRTGTRSLDNPIQIENTCTAYGATNATNADGVVYINGNVFQPPRLMVDTFSQMFYGSYQPTNLWDSRFPDAVSYSSAPLGGYTNFYQRAGVVGSNGQPNSQFIDPRYAGAMGGAGGFGQSGFGSGGFGGAGFGGVGGNGLIPPAGQFPQQAIGVPRQAAFGQYGLSGYADPYGGGSFFDIRRQNFQRNWTISWVNQDPIPHSFKCTDRSGNAVVQVNSIAPGAVYTQLISNPGLYHCKLENTNTGTIKIKSMCPKKGALYYTRLITRCMARKAIGDSGLLDGGKQHAARVAAAVKTKFTAFAGRFNVEQTDKNAKVSCSATEGGAQCSVKITPLVPRNGFGFAIQDATGNPNYEIRLKPGGTIHPSCFTYDQLDKTQTYRALLDPLVSGVSAIGLTSAPNVASFAIKFNENDNCVKIRPDSANNFRPYLYNPETQKFVQGDGYTEFILQSNSNPNVKYTIKLIISPTQNPDEFLDGRFLFTTIPTIPANGPNKLFYRTKTAGDPREPGFVLNNLPEDPVGLLPPSGNGEAVIVQPNSIGVLSGNEVSTADKLASISQLKDGFALCTEKGGCAPEGGTAKILTPFTAEQKGGDDLAGTAMKLGDVIGNYKFEPSSTPKNLAEADKPFVCSGTNYCSAATEAAAVDAAQKQVEEAFKKQYQYVETFNLDSTMDNMQDALTDCMATALSEVAAQEVQFQMCKTLVDFCGNPNYIDPEEEEIEGGESFAGGLTLDGVLGDSRQIITDVMCQETQAGQNLQALRPCLQPGNRACRDLIARRIVGNLRQAKVQSVAKEVPIVSIKDPVINFVTKRIQGDPKLSETDTGSTLSLGGYNVYQFAADREKLIGEAGRQNREEGKVIFDVRPPGYDFSKAVVTASAGISGGAFLPFRLPEVVYDWATSTAQQLDSNKLAQITLGFPYVVGANPDTSGTVTSTRVEFDKFQPTLLTLNKYPVMRAVINKAHETTDAAEAVNTANEKCTVTNRPVDPLDLFDDCEEQRPNQAEYDKKPTAEKNPFARSLVFEAIPAGKTGDNLRVVWPAGYSSETFQVAIPPEYEFTTSGATTAGVSAPLVASIPVLGRALYPLKDSRGKFEPLEIKGDVKKYAVQVTDCKYTRQADGSITMDSGFENNCAASQWPIGILFPGSTRDSLSMTFNGQEVKCEKGQACIAGQLIGSHLKVAVVDGLVSNAPSDKLKDSSSTSITLSAVARDLMRYYVDESYIPTRLLDVLKDSNGNNCELKATPVSFLLKCGQAITAPAGGTGAAPSSGNTYGFAFLFGDSVSKALDAKFQAITDPATGAQLRQELSQKAMESKVKVTCTSTTGAPVAFEANVQPYSIDQTNGVIKVIPVGNSIYTYSAPAPVTSCTAIFELSDIPKLQETATPTTDNILLFDFTKATTAPINNQGGPAGSTCTATAKLRYGSYGRGVAYNYAGTEFALQYVIMPGNPPVDIATSTAEVTINGKLDKPNYDPSAKGFVFKQVTGESLLSQTKIDFTIKKGTATTCTGSVQVPALEIAGTLSKEATGADAGRQFFTTSTELPTKPSALVFSTPTADVVTEQTVERFSSTNKKKLYLPRAAPDLDKKVVVLINQDDEIIGRIDTGLTVAAQAPAPTGQAACAIDGNNFKGEFVLLQRADTQLKLPIEVSSSQAFPVGGQVHLSADASDVASIAAPGTQPATAEPFHQTFYSTVKPENGDFLTVTLNKPDGAVFCTATRPRFTTVQPCDAGNAGTLSVSGAEVWISNPVANFPYNDHKFFVPGQTVHDITLSADSRYMIPDVHSRPPMSYLVEKSPSGSAEYGTLICAYTEPAAPPAPAVSQCTGTGRLILPVGATSLQWSISIQKTDGTAFPAGTVQLVGGSTTSTVAQGSIEAALVTGGIGISAISAYFNVRDSSNNAVCSVSVPLSQLSSCKTQANWNSVLNTWNPTAPNPIRVTTDFSSSIEPNRYGVFAPGEQLHTIVRPAFNLEVQGLPVATAQGKTTYLIAPSSPSATVPTDVQCTFNPADYNSR